MKGTKWPTEVLGDPDVSLINPKTDLNHLNDDSLVSFIPMEIVQEGMNRAIPMNRPLEEVRKGYTIFSDGDLLWAKITPCMQNGKSTLVRDLTNGVGFGSTEFHVIRAQKKALSSYLWALLCMPRLLYAAQAAFTGSSGHQRVPASFLETLEIPLPPLEIQRRLVAELDAARAERDRALAEANDLLKSLDHHTLDALGIYPEDDHRHLFAVRLADVRNRLDADFHSPRFQRLRRAIAHCRYETRRLGELAVFMRTGFAAGRQAQAKGDEPSVPHLRPLNLNGWGELSIAETKRVPASMVSEDSYIQPGEVLFNNTNSAEWVGKSAVFDLPEPCACSNHMTRIQLKPGHDPYFLAALLNAFRGIGYFSALSTFFNNQAGINTSTLAALLIPVPGLDQQRDIAQVIRERKQRAGELRARAETIWHQARANFERQLLDEAKA